MTVIPDVLQEELADARARLAVLARARRQLEQRVRDARVAEATAKQGLEVLESVARETLGGAAPGELRLAGGQLRAQLARSALRRDPGEPAHWRRWLAWLREDGYDAAGKSPEATFLTQLTRSPLVRRANREAVYVLDVALVRALRERLRALDERLRHLPPPDQLALLDDGARITRRQVQLEIDRIERGLREACGVLSEERPSWADVSVRPNVDLWLNGPPDEGQLALTR